MTTVQQTGGSYEALMEAMNPKKKAQKTGVEETQDRFMTLLVTQMRNQDPLNPLDNAQVTSQFAQLSTVTGVEKLNKTLEVLQGSYQTSQSLQAASMIGHGVLVPGSTFALSEGRAVMGIEATEPADDAKLVILGGDGKPLKTINLGRLESGTIRPVTWDGITDTGAKAADGSYSFEIRATRGGEKAKATALSFGEVLSVTTGGDGVKLNVPGMGVVKFGDVRQIL
ncbi:MAG TPA: flagellar hook assembly protein FlgD [Paucimonas sp.]|nr:flagellar hook assembly protein FlgD [Paucimonas sp.]